MSPTPLGRWPFYVGRGPSNVVQPTIGGDVLNERYLGRMRCALGHYVARILDCQLLAKRQHGRLSPCTIGARIDRSLHPARLSHYHPLVLLYRRTESHNGRPLGIGAALAYL